MFSLSSRRQIDYQSCPKKVNNGLIPANLKGHSAFRTGVSFGLPHFGMHRTGVESAIANRTPSGLLRLDSDWTQIGNLESLLQEALRTCFEFVQAVRAALSKDNLCLWLLSAMGMACRLLRVFSSRIWACWGPMIIAAAHSLQLSFSNR